MRLAPTFLPHQHQPFPRFIKFPSKNSWNQLRSLSDDEISLLAHCLVEQIKLRGPFLSFSDFVNRRVQGITSNRLDSQFRDWGNQFPETRDSVLGFRGALQAAICEAEINQSQFSKQAPSGNVFTGNKGEWPDNPMIPFFLGLDLQVHFLHTFEHLIPWVTLIRSLGYTRYLLNHFTSRLHSHTWASFNPQR